MLRLGVTAANRLVRATTRPPAPPAPAHRVRVRVRVSVRVRDRVASWSNEVAAQG